MPLCTNTSSSTTSEAYLAYTLGWNKRADQDEPNVDAFEFGSGHASLCLQAGGGVAEPEDVWARSLSCRSPANFNFGQVTVCAPATALWPRVLFLDRFLHPHALACRQEPTQRARRSAAA
jgi:hypothetical protein